MNKKIFEMEEIAAFGCGMIIDVRKHIPKEIESIVSFANTKQSQIILKNARLIVDKKTVAESGKGNVIFDLS